MIESTNELSTESTILVFYNLVDAEFAMYRIRAAYPQSTIEIRDEFGEIREASILSQHQAHAKWDASQEKVEPVNVPHACTLDVVGVNEADLLELAFGNVDRDYCEDFAGLFS